MIRCPSRISAEEEEEADVTPVLSEVSVKSVSTRLVLVDNEQDGITGRKPVSCTNIPAMYTRAVVVSTRLPVSVCIVGML